MTDRTPEEREAARRERDARRRGAPFEEPPPAGAQPGWSPPEPQRSQPGWSAPPPAPQQPTTGWSPPPPGPRDPQPDWSPSSPQQPAPDWPPAGAPAEGSPTTVRALFAKPQRNGGPRAAPDPQAMDAAPRRPQSGERERGGRRLAPRIFAGAALLVALAAIWFLVELFQPFYGSGHGSVVVVIHPGTSTGAIGDQLAREGVISSSFFFGLRAALAGDRGKLLAGTYHLKHGMSYGTVLSRLTTPPPAVPTTNVTIIPGRTRRQIALLLHRQGVHGRFLTDTEHTTVLNVQSYGAPATLDNLEGFLFPSTYQLRTPITIPALVHDELTAFRQQFATVNMSYARSQHLSPYEVLIIASMVEAEAGTAHDRPLIASVIYNRLRLGMTLGIDATIRYAVNNYSTPLTDSQLNSSSPYNTRTHAGLPPTPIDNPGLASIQAAAAPAHTSYLYFVAKPCGNGASAFASTSAQFNLDVIRYNEARNQRGGRSPLKC